MTQPGTPQLNALTGLRGIAAWLVVAYHYREALAQIVPGAVLAAVGRGALAVDLFFVMSGFIIALNYGKEFRAEGARVYGRFLLLRLARIYPLHIAMLGFFVLFIGGVSLAHGTDEFHDLGYLIRSLFLVQAWQPGVWPAWNVPAWSISTEMFAYLIFPLMAWVAERAPWGAALALLGAPLLVLMLVAPGYGNLMWDIGRLGLARCVLEFFAGVMVQRLWELGRRTPASGAAALAAGALLIACLAWDVPESLMIPGAFCCLVYGFAVPGTMPVRLLAGRLPVLIGTLSYATYLSQDLVKFWVKFVFERPGVPAWVPFPAYVAIMLVVSWLLYELVEVPGRRLLRRVADRVTAAPRLPVSRG